MMLYVKVLSVTALALGFFLGLAMGKVEQCEKVMCFDEGDGTCSIRHISTADRELTQHWQDVSTRMPERPR